MKRLKLNFLEQPIDINSLNPIEAILHEYGQEIYEYAKGYFNYIVSTSSFNDQINESSLYIVVPEMGYDYKILTLRYNGVEKVTLYFYTLKTQQIENDQISIKKDWEDVHLKISALLNSDLANRTLKFLVDQVNLKRNSKVEE